MLPRRSSHNINRSMSIFAYIKPFIFIVTSHSLVLIDWSKSFICMHMRSNHKVCFPIIPQIFKSSSNCSRVHKTVIVVPFKRRKVWPKPNTRSHVSATVKGSVAKDNKPRVCFSIISRKIFQQKSILSYLEIWPIVE